MRWVRVAARVAGWPRRVLAAVLLLAAVVVALRPGPPAPAAAAPTRAVVVAARDLAAGTVLAAADLRAVSVPDALVPAGAAARTAPLVGRVAAGPLRRGETVTDARVVGPGLTAGLSRREYAAVPVRLAEPEAAAVLRAGDLVDVLGTPVGADGTGVTPTGDPVDVAAGVRVLAVLGGTEDGVVVVVAAAPAVARRLAGATTRLRLMVTVRPP